MAGRRRRGHHEEHHVDERWLVSYSDMITVLMALFIVLYALSTVDQKKFDELKNSLASGFGVTKTEKVDANTGIVRKEDVNKKGHGFSNSTIALMQVAKEIQDELKTAGLAGKVKVATGSNSITISLVGSSTYFEGNEADLSPNALQVLRKLSPTLEKHAGDVTVEGHADPRGSAGRWGDDWNLASARANSVRGWLVDHDSVDPAKVSLVSWGSEHARKGTSAKAVEHNRRVDIVLHSVQVATVPATTATAEKATSGEGESSTAHGKTATASTADAKTGTASTGSTTTGTAASGDAKATSTGHASTGTASTEHAEAAGH